MDCLWRKLYRKKVIKMCLTCENGNYLLHEFDSVFFKVYDPLSHAYAKFLDFDYFILAGAIILLLYSTTLPSPSFIHEFRMSTFSL